MKFIGTVLTTFVVFLAAVWLWDGLPETLNGQEFLYQGASAFTYSLVSSILGFFAVLLFIIGGAFVGALFDNGEVGAAIGLILYIPVGFVLSGLLLHLFGAWIPWFTKFTFWQIVVVIVTKFVIGALFGNYNTKSSKSE